MKITAAQLAPVAAFYNQCLYLQAYRAAEAIAPLHEWEGTDALLLAGRLANNIGSSKLGRQLHQKAYRLDPTSGEAAYYKVRVILERRGPLAAWRFLHKIGATLNASTTVQADWLAFHGIVLGALRDFDAAEEWLAKAEKLDPENPWIWIERSHLCELEDKYEEALAAAQHALELRPNFRPGVQAVAGALVFLGRDEEALAMLNEAADKIESCWLLAQLANLQTELGLHTEARQSIERFVEFAPLLDKGTEQWLHAQRADAAYLCGDYEAALHFTQLSESPFHKLVAERMQAANGEAKRVLLPVGFVRQHHMTCAPATLTFLSRYWQMPVDHLSVVEAICYDGTPARSERDWAETQGWFVREFCVNWEDTVKLIDRGVPFTLTTVDPGNAHLQAVIGYDSRRGTILARDPYDRNLIEYAAKEMLERYSASGPRGMAMVPLAQKHLLEDLALHEAPLYDALYEVQQALFAHQREAVEAPLQAMLRDAENHRLTHLAQLSIAEYDCDDARVLASLDKLLVLFPDDANSRLHKLAILRRMARREERMELLQAIYADKKSHPLFWQMYAAELSDDGRAQAKVRKLLQRTMRYGATDAHNFYLLAIQHWTQQRFAEAKELYRFAACLKDTDENYVRAYFSAAQYFHEQAEALRFLQSRFQRFGKRSGSPARTLSWAYEQTGQQPRALAVLREGLALRPDDAELALYAVDTFARLGKFDEAQALLAQAESKARRVDWLHSKAVVAAYRNETPAALATWQQVLEAEPLNLSATRNIAQSLADTSGEEAVIAFLRARVAQFPHNVALHRLFVEWSRSDAQAYQQAIRAMVEVDPVDAWARRELAIALLNDKQFDEALTEIELAQRLEPGQTYGYNVLARVYTEMGKLDDAKAAYREALRLSVDNDFAMANLLSLSPSAAERRAVLQFIKDELVRQVTFGDGLLAYREHARGTLTAEELRDVLQEALQTRPDLWHAWSALIQQLIDMQHYDEALPLAQQAAEFFPLVPRIWVDLSFVQQARLDRQGEIAALEKALEINPTWGQAIRQLADAYLNSGALQQARTMLEQAIAQAPLDAFNYGYLADVQWRLGEKEAALQTLKRAVTLEPGYEWAWNTLRLWSKELKHEDEVAALVREVVAKRPNEPRSWLLLAENLRRSEDLPERLQALDRANEGNPRYLEAHLLRAGLLADARRFDEARAACHPPIFNGDLPLRLRNTAALIESASGNREAAIEQMRVVVAEEPNNYEGWSYLADWTRGDDNRKAEYLAAATELVRISPNFVISLGYLGEARLRNGDRAGAKEAFQRAFALSPDYDFAGVGLFDLQLADSEYEAAATTLNGLRQHVGGALVTLRAIELAAKQIEVESAGQHLRELCRAPDVTGELLNIAAQLFIDRLWGEQLDHILSQALDWPDANAVVGDVWVERWFDSSDHSACLKRLTNATEKHAMWQNAAGAYLAKLADANRTAPARQFIQQFAADLRRDVNSWGMTGYALVTLNREAEVIDWLADWREREDVRPWMLWNGVIALRTQKREREAYEMSQHALQLPPDSVTAAHRVWVACADALAGEAEEAAEQLRAVSYGELREWDQFEFDTATAVIDFARSQQAFAGLKQLLQLGRLRNTRRFFWRSAALYRSHQQALRYIATTSDNVLVQLLAYSMWGWLLVRWAVFRAV